MKKIISIVLILTITMSLLTGCMGENIAMTISADGSCSFNMTYLYEQSFFDGLMSQPGSSTDTSIINSGDFTKSMTTIQDKTYYSFNRMFTFASTSEMTQFLIDHDTFYNKMIADSKNPSAYQKENLDTIFSKVTMDTNTFIGAIADEQTNSNVTSTNLTPGSSAGNSTNSTDYYQSMGIVLEISVTLPNVISESNGTMNGSTASWNLGNIPADGKLIAVSGDNPIISSDHTTPVIQGVKNKGLYSGKVSIQASDDVCLKSLLLNGKEYGTSHYSLTKAGTYTLLATDTNQNQTSLTFRIDTKKPTVKGVKSGKTYKRAVSLRFSDANGIKQVKVNGRKANTKKVKYKKKGAYTVKVWDKAGNLTTIKFRIK